MQPNVCLLIQSGDDYGFVRLEDGNGDFMTREQWDELDDGDRRMSISSAIHAADHIDVNIGTGMIVTEPPAKLWEE